MRKGLCVPMMTLCLLACTACAGSGQTEETAAARHLYQTMEGCTMTARVKCGGQTEEERSFTLRCGYVPGGRSTVEILEPEIAAGVTAAVEGETLQLTYDGACLDAGTAAGAEDSPAVCLVRLMDALRDGWLVEQGQETLENEACLRLTLDQADGSGGKILSTLWLRRADGTPLRGEIARDGEIILSAEFTAFAFGAILNGQSQLSGAASSAPPGGG